MADSVPHFPPPRLPRRSGGYPIKLMHGVHDLIAMPKHASKLAGRLGARLVMVDGGHLITRECAAQVGRKAGRQLGPQRREGDADRGTRLHSHHGPSAHCLQCRYASSCSSWHCQRPCLQAEDAGRPEALPSRPRLLLLVMQDPHGSGVPAAQDRAGAYRAGVCGMQHMTRSRTLP